MDTAVTTAGPSIHFLNVEYFFRLLYDLVFSAHLPTVSGFTDWATTVWLFVTLISYLISMVLIGLLVYFSTRLYQTADDDAKRYTTLAPAVAHEKVVHSRWAYIRELIESSQQSDWRQAIIEADIMLDELLTTQGFVGDSVGEKLKQASRDHFHTLDDAWSAHKVRNDIAHQGSAYELSDHTAYRTIGQFENVFREFNAI